MEASIVLIKDGKSRIVLDGKTLGGIPNGVVLSPDEKTPLSRTPASGCASTK